MKNVISQSRKENKIIQEELTSEARVTGQTITSMENGKHTALLPLVLKITKFFEIKIEDISTVEGDD